MQLWLPCRASYTSNVDTGALVATLPAACGHEVIPRTGWLCVSVLCLGEIAYLIFNVCLSVAAPKIVRADPSLNYALPVVGTLNNRPTSRPWGRTPVWLCRLKFDTVVSSVVVLNPDPVNILFHTWFLASVSRSPWLLERRKIPIFIFYLWSKTGISVNGKDRARQSERAGTEIRLLDVLTAALCQPVAIRKTDRGFLSIASQRWPPGAAIKSVAVRLIKKNWGLGFVCLFVVVAVVALFFGRWGWGGGGGGESCPYYSRVHTTVILMIIVRNNYRSHSYHLLLDLWLVNRTKVDILNNGTETVVTAEYELIIVDAAAQSTMCLTSCLLSHR